MSTPSDTTEDVTETTSGHVGDAGPTAKAAPIARRVLDYFLLGKTDPVPPVTGPTRDGDDESD